MYVKQGRFIDFGFEPCAEDLNLPEDRIIEDPGLIKVDRDVPDNWRERLNKHLTEPQWISDTEVFSKYEEMWITTFPHDGFTKIARPMF